MNKDGCEYYVAWEQGEDPSLVDFTLKEYRKSKKMAVADLSNNVSTSQATQRWERVLPLLLFFPGQRVTLEIKRDLLQAECGRPEQSIKLAALVFLVLHDEGVLLTEIRFAKICCR